MNTVLLATRGWLRAVGEGWNRFWFTPAEPHTLAAIRIMAGAMLFYTHLVWSLDLNAFLGEKSWLSREYWLLLHRDAYVWSYLWWIRSPALLWIAHLAALLVFALLTVGLFTRVVAVLAWIITVAYCHRLSGALFGLDQVNAMLSMYLMLAPCGMVYSLDHYLARRRSPGRAAPTTSVAVNIAIRLIQLHMCVIYLFGGIEKMRGADWWDGSAVWFAIANYEYQSLDVTWLIRWPLLISLLTHVTVFWETFYCALIWPRVTRPIVLGIAVCVHGGIALFLGMITFGLAMLIGNVAFVSPTLVRDAVGTISRRRGRAGEGTRQAAVPASRRRRTSGRKQAG